MKSNRMSCWLLVICFCFSCVACVWAWLYAIHLLFFGIEAVPSFFLQALIRRGGKEWSWLLIVHAIILLCSAGIGGLIILLTQNMAQLYGLLLAAVAGFALAGCLFELIIYLMFGGKDEKNETENEPVAEHTNDCVGSRLCRVVAN